MPDAVVHVRPRFQSAYADGSDPSRFQPSYWNADRLFTGGINGQFIVRDDTSPTGALWSSLDVSGFVLTTDSRLSDARTPIAHTHPWSDITGRPTTTAGYGITDAVLVTRTINGHALNADVIVTKSDVGLSAVENTALSTGNAATATLAASATKLATSRLIYGNGFDGTTALAQIIDPSFGGTGLGVYVVGDLLYASAVGALSRLAATATGRVLISNGVGVAPSWSSGPTLTTLTTTGLITGQNLTLASSATITFGTLGAFVGGADGQFVYRNNANSNSISFGPGTILLNHNFAGNAIVANGAGIFLFSNEAQTIGFTLNGSVADVLTIKNRGNSATASLVASNMTVDATGIHGFAGVSNGLKLVVGATALVASDGGAYLYVGGGNVNVNSAYLAMMNGGTTMWRWNAITTDGKLSFVNGAATSGASFDVTTDAVLKLRDRAQTAYATLDCLGLKVSGVAGATFGPAAPASITVVNGIVTAVS